MRVMKIERRAIGDTITLTGNVQAQTEINQAFRIDGSRERLSIGDVAHPGHAGALLSAASGSRRNR